MGTPDRLHRTDAERLGPLRHAGTLLRELAPDPHTTHSMPRPDEAACDDNAVAHGVRLGYQVIDEQILEGQRLAQRLGHSTQAMPAGGGSDVNALIERALALYKDLGKLCIDAVARSGAVKSAFAAAVQPAQNTPEAHGHPVAASTHADVPSRFAIEVSSRHRVQVSLDLHMPAHRFQPKVHALHAGDPSIAPLTGLRFDADPALPEPVLRIEVPELQPVATYSGIVVDGLSNEPRGFLTVRLLA